MSRILPIILLLGSLNTAMPVHALPLIPAPQSVAPQGGEFALTRTTTLLVATGRPDLAERLAPVVDLLRQGTGLDLPLAEADQPRPGAIFVGPLPEAAPEAYTLDVLPDGIVLRAGGPDGVTWGLQTLRQLLPAAVETPLPPLVDDPGRPDGTLRPLPAHCRYPRNNLRPAPAAPTRTEAASPAVACTVPCVRIADQPRFGWRGVLLDCCRHYLDLTAIERVIDLMSLHKLNRLHWHLTEDQGWRLAIDAYPRLTEVAAWRTDQDGVRYGGYYTQDQARHVVDYAARRGITVVPEIEMPGHSQAALAAYPELGCRQADLAVQSCWGVWPDVYCAGREETFAFLETVLTEVLDIFPSEFIHVGGDECPKDRWRACPRCQERIRQEGLADEHELQSWFIRRMERWLAARGRRLIGWDEILEGGLAPGATVQSWRGFEGAVAAAVEGHDTVVSPTSHAYFDYDIGTTDLAEIYAYEPVPAELDAEQARHVLGGEMNLWTEYAPQAVLDERLLPRLCAMSEVLWSPAPPHPERAGRDVDDPAVVGRDLTGFWRRLTGHYRRLDRLGLRRAGEGRPVTLTAAWDPERAGWLLAWEADERRPAGAATVEVTIGGQRHVEAVEGTAVRQEPGLVCAQLMVDGRPFGAPQRLELVRNLALGRPVSVTPEPAARYHPTVPDPVTDGVLPDGDYHDGRWLAWEGPDAEVIVDLGASTPIREATAVCLHAGGRLIYSPEEIAVSVSTDQASWTPLGSASWVLAPGVMARVLRTYRLAVDQPLTARYVRFELQQRQEVPAWPWAPDSPPWLFLGQLIIK